MRAFYEITQTIKNTLLLDEFCNTVNFGGIDEVLLSKQDIYPYSHLILNGATYEGNTLRFDISVIAMDIVDISNDKTTDIFIGNDNSQDVLNTQLAVLVRMLEVLRRGENANTFKLDGTPSFEHFTDRFEHGVAGWTVTFDIVVPHGMTIC